MGRSPTRRAGPFAFAALEGVRFTTRVFTTGGFTTGPVNTVPVPTTIVGSGVMTNVGHAGDDCTCTSLRALVSHDGKFAGSRAVTASKLTMPRVGGR